MKSPLPAPHSPLPAPHSPLPAPPLGECHIAVASSFSGIEALPQRGSGEGAVRVFFFFILFFIGLFLGAKAQEHSVFLGLPLGGERGEFVDSLEAKGFIFEDEANECTWLSGLFDGVGASIEVHCTPRSHTVHRVVVRFVEIQGNEVGLLMKTRQIRNRLKKKYGAWDYTREGGTEEWSSPWARISLGKVRLQGDRFKTLFVEWQDRIGWEALQQESR